MIIYMYVTAIKLINVNFFLLFLDYLTNIASLKTRDEKLNGELK